MCGDGAEVCHRYYNVTVVLATLMPAQAVMYGDH